jgi:hypothetical protein
MLLLQLLQLYNNSITKNSHTKCTYIKVNKILHQLVTELVMKYKAFKCYCFINETC